MRIACLHQVINTGFDMSYHETSDLFLCDISKDIVEGCKIVGVEIETPRGGLSWSSLTDVPQASWTIQVRGCLVLNPYH